MKSKIITILVIVIIFVCFFYILDEIRNNDLKQINQNFKYTKGVVIKKTAYKGRHIRVKYKINGKEYIQSDGYDVDDVINVGDTISVKYANDNPDLMITEYNESY